MPNSLKLFLLLFSVQSCSYKAAPYFKPIPGIATFNVQFKLHSDPILYDTIKKEFQIINIENQQAFYLIDTKDIGKNYFTLGAKYFTRSAMLIRNDSIFLAPVSDVYALDKLTLASFNYVIPPKLNPGDTIKIIDKLKIQVLLYGFNKSSLRINGRKLNNCLNIKIIERHPENGKQYYGQVWLNKNYGVVQYLYVTGRLEQRQL